MTKRRVVLDEYSQEEFSEESINVNSVLTWKVDAAERLRVDFHHEIYFDSAATTMNPERVKAAIEKLRSFS